MIDDRNSPEQRIDDNEMYGDIDDLPVEPMQLDGQKMAELGHRTRPASSSAVIRYTAGCIKRERERLAKIFIKHQSPTAIAEAILDTSLDDFVFKWNGPEVRLDVPPKSTAEREADDAYRPMTD